VVPRLMILAGEDIGMADPTTLLTAVAAPQPVQLMLTMSEAQFRLAHATVNLATAPQSNAVTMALCRSTFHTVHGVELVVQTFEFEGASDMVNN
jgi:replication-associated recombination protein RarA